MRLLDGREYGDRIVCRHQCKLRVTWTRREILLALLFKLSRYPNKSASIHDIARTAVIIVEALVVTLARGVFLLTVGIHVSVCHG